MARGYTPEVKGRIPLARLISVANEFCRHAVPAHRRPGVAPLEAIALIMKADAGTGNETDTIGSVFLLGIMNLFKIKPPIRFLAAQKQIGVWND